MRYCNESSKKSISSHRRNTRNISVLYHGDYPFVTSKDVTASGICSDVGIGPKKVDDVILVFKAYVTRVGCGPLENEISPDEAAKSGRVEYGSVTGRQRRASPFNLGLAKKSIKINSATQLAVTKLDVVFPNVRPNGIFKLTSKQTIY